MWVECPSAYRHEDLSLGCKVVFVPKHFALVQPLRQMHNCADGSHSEQRCWTLNDTCSRLGNWVLQAVIAMGIQRRKKLIQTGKIKEGYSQRRWWWLYPVSVDLVCLILMPVPRWKKILGWEGLMVSGYPGMVSYWSWVTLWTFSCGTCVNEGF